MANGKVWAERRLRYSSFDLASLPGSDVGYEIESERGMQSGRQREKKSGPDTLHSNERQAKELASKIRCNSIQLLLSCHGDASKLILLRSGSQKKKTTDCSSHSATVSDSTSFPKGTDL